MAVITTPQTTVSTDELCALFCGIPDEWGGWETAPVHSTTLIVEICRRITPASVYPLRKHLFGDCDDLPQGVEDIISLGFQRYWQTRHQQGTRGL